jgi:hypothetical protein
VVSKFTGGYFYLTILKFNQQQPKGGVYTNFWGGRHYENESAKNTSLRLGFPTI